MTNSVTFHKDASHDEVTVVFGGGSTTIDLSTYDRKVKSRLVLSLSDWVLRGGKGYPDLGVQ